MKLRRFSIKTNPRRPGFGFVALCSLLISVLSASPALGETVRQGQWFIDNLNLATVQSISRGDGVVVAVVDTGVEPHPDLGGHLLTGNSFGTASGLSAQQDTDGHGTAMAGLIAAQGGGANNALGVAPGARLLPVRVGVAGGSKGASDITGDAIADGIRWASDNGAQVINISLALEGTPSETQKTAVAYALSKDIVVVVGSGNIPEGYTSMNSLGLIPGVVGVGATDQTSTVWSGTTAGPQMALSAPGVNMVSTGSVAAGHASGFVIGNGTSDATAIVSGTAALIRAKYPTMKAPDVINRLITTAKDLGPAGRDSSYGYGEIQPEQALTADVPHVDRNPLLPAETTTTTSPSATTHKSSSSSDSSTAAALGGLAIIIFVIVVPFAALIIRRRKRRNRLAASQAISPPITPPVYELGHQPMQPQPPVPGPQSSTAYQPAAPQSNPQPIAHVPSAPFQPPTTMPPPGQVAPPVDPLQPSATQLPPQPPIPPQTNA